jgi:hypothetical protein
MTSRQLVHCNLGTTVTAPVPTTLTGTMLWNALRDRSDTIHTRAQVGFTPEQSQLRLKSAIESMWASTTFQDRRYLIERWMRWCVHYDQEPTPAAAALFIMAIPRITAQTQLAYTKAFSGTFKHLGWDRQDLLTLATALRAQGAAIPVEQAKPLNKPDLIQWLDQISDPMLKLTAMMCWKTASRWGDMIMLTREHIVEATANEIIVSWSTLPKGRKANPYTPSMYTVIHGPWTEEIFALIQRIPLPDKPFCPWTTDKLDAELKKVPHMAQYTGHSFKRGAATHAIAEAERLKIDLKPSEISVLLKHKLTYDLLSSSDLRYPEAGPGLARLLGTQNVTRLL